MVVWKDRDRGKHSPQESLVNLVDASQAAMSRQAVILQPGRHQRRQRGCFM